MSGSRPRRLRRIEESALNLDDIIKYEDEGTNLDFKRDEYGKQKRVSLIKDVMSMANALNPDVKRIIIGVKHVPGKDNEIIGLSEITDQANFENIIQENVEPNINFSYRIYDFEGKKLGILEICDNDDRPYMMKKDFSGPEKGERSGLVKGDMWIRKGSRQSRVTRQDLDKMYNMRENLAFENKVKIVLDQALKKDTTLVKTDVKEEDLPSRIRKKELEKPLKRLRERYRGTPTKSSASNPLKGPIRNFADFDPFSEFNDSEKSIRMGDVRIGLPVYKNEEQILDCIEKLPQTYAAEDNYFLFEEKANKFNCYIYNDGSGFLEDVKIELFFDSNVFFAFEDFCEKPRSSDLEALFDPPKFSLTRINYPNVWVGDGITIAEQEHNHIRHKEFTQVFLEDLRILPKPNAAIGVSEVRYKISARNLPSPIEDSIFINIVEPD